MGRIDSLFGANRLTFRGETTRGEQVIGVKRPGFEVMHCFEGTWKLTWKDMIVYIFFTTQYNWFKFWSAWDISIYFTKYKKILCISINIYLYTQLPVDPRDQSLFKYINIASWRKKKTFFFKLIKYICCCIEVCFYKMSRILKK